MSKNPKLWAIVAILIAIVSVQLGATLSKHVFPLVGSEGTTALRQFFATVSLLIVFQPWRGGPERKHWPVLALYGAILGVMNLVFYASIARIPLGIAVALEFSGPLTVAILGSRKWSDFIWVACAVAGLLILLPWQGLGGEGSTALDLLGVVYALIAGVLWGLYIIVGQKVGDRVHGGKAVALGMAFSTIFTVPIGVAFAGASLLSPTILFYGVGIGILASAIPYALEMIALKAMPAKTFGLMMSLEPAVAALLGLVILHELLTPLQWLAVALVIIASAGSSLTAKRGSNDATA
ncbi:EamA family transporter [Asticcacaulis taihuensis]|uniref:Inner membrane transporter RhtA n=1 Tax=Asticcacaulis taihuensis TaxID=260084 RepID=A0A1G4QK72_9CAUL|nr:DMT family transporter [Asticcacaulis taihuensis]SCW44479.1 inner membrane transporter RhtA [Asticcacaulis taihuensis]